MSHGYDSANCRRGCTTPRTCRGTSRRPASSTRTSSACRCSRPGARRTCCSAPSAPTATASSGSRDGGALAFFQFAEPGGPGAVRAEDAVHAVPPHRAARRRGDAGRHRAAAARTRATRSRRSFVLEHGYCRSVYATDPERHDRRVHARSSGRREDQRDARGTTRTPSSSAGSRATTPRTTRFAEGRPMHAAPTAS